MVVGRSTEAKARKPLESDIQRAVLAFLDHHPRVLVWRMNTGAMRVTGKGGRPRVMRFGRPGQADITGLIRPWGVRLEIEVKRPGEKQTEEQVAFGLAIGAAGGVYIVVHSVDEARIGLEQAIAQLEAVWAPRTWTR